MVPSTLPAHQKRVKDQTLAAPGRQGGTEARWVKVCFCVTAGQKLRKVPSRSFFQGMDEALSAIKVLQHGLTPPLSPHTPSPRVWAGDWVLVRKVSDGVPDEGLGPWSIK